MEMQQKTRLLAVDDNLPLAELIVRVAERCGYEARTLVNSYFLAQTLNEWRPDILTLDLSMPQEDGVSLLSILEQRHFDGRIVIISGQQDWMRKSASRLAAARGLHLVKDLEKPVDIAVLRQVLMDLRQPAATE
jgi:DNA-binding NtrC family response regulator